MVTKAQEELKAEIDKIDDEAAIEMIRKFIVELLSKKKAEKHQMGIISEKET